MAIEYRTDLIGVDWESFKQDLIADDFHNGRTTGQLKLSFENSSQVVMVWDERRVIGSARQLSDGVGNAYVVDVWTLSAYRERGIATRMMKMLVDAVPGQHIYLQADDAVDFYKKIGFTEQPVGLRIISGEYLQNETRE